MLQDVYHQQEQLPIEDISSPIAAQILDFCDDAGLFTETLRGSDVSSCSGAVDSNGVIGGSGDGSHCSYEDNSFASNYSSFSPIDAATLSAILDTQLPPDHNPNAPGGGFEYSSSSAHLPHPMLPLPSSCGHDQQGHLDQIILSDAMANAYQLPMAGPGQHEMLPLVYEDECLPPLPAAYMGIDLSPASLVLDAAGVGTYYATGMPAFGENQGFYAGGAMMGPEQCGMTAQELLEYQRVDGGVYGTEPMQPVYSSGDMQVVGDYQQHPNATMAASDIAALDESSFKVGRLSVEERKEKIHRYMKKRNERNFSKKIKYACRKTLADSRPRVRGRFAKNDEFGETSTKTNSGSHEYEDEEEVVMKEDEDILNSSDILAHISGVNSFKYNYTLESWI